MSSKINFTDIFVKIIIGVAILVIGGFIFSVYDNNKNISLLANKLDSSISLLNTKLDNNIGALQTEFSELKQRLNAIDKEHSQRLNAIDKELAGIKSHLGFIKDYLTNNKLSEAYNTDD